MLLILRITTALISAYMLLIFIRVLLTWFGSGSFGRASELLGGITDPYLNYFRRFSFLRFGRLDFSPIAGIIILVIVLNILNTILLYGKVTLGIILMIFLQASWSAVSFLLNFFILLIAIRLIMELISPSSHSPLKTTLETIVNPVVLYIKNLLIRKRFISYRMQMAMTGGLLIALSLGGNAIIRILAGLLMKLPV